MFCKNCGAQNPDDVKFCQSCGSAVGEQPANPDAGAPAGEQNQPVTNGAYADPAPATLSMKWHKFLVYFALWAGALINLVNGLQSLSGSQYGEYKGWVYALFSGLQAADMAYGVVLLVCAALGCFVAYSLLKMKKGAPKLLMILYAVSGAVAIPFPQGVILVGYYGCRTGAAGIEYS